MLALNLNLRSFIRSNQEMKNLKIIFISLVSTLSYVPVAYSGGPYWQFKVNDISKIGTNYHQIKVTPIGSSNNERDKFFPYECPEVIIFAKYISKNDYPPHMFNLESYNQAISLIKDAHSQNKEISIGEINLLGLESDIKVKESEKNMIEFLISIIKIIFFNSENQNVNQTQIEKMRSCKVHSKGLEIFEFSDNDKAIYSYYHD